MSSCEPQPACSAVIVSGGLSSRMGGQNKTFLELGGRTLLQIIVSTLQPFFQDILLVTRQPELYQDYAVRVVTDVYEARSSLTGIHAGLVHARNDFAFITACDAPFLKPALIDMLLQTINPDIDLVVPRLKKHYEPLCAIYSRKCIPFIEAQLEREDFQIFRFFDQMRVRFLGLEDVRSVDPQLHSFFNINTPETWRAARDMVAGGIFSA